MFFFLFIQCDHNLVGGESIASYKFSHPYTYSVCINSTSFPLYVSIDDDKEEDKFQIYSSDNIVHQKSAATMPFIVRLIDPVTSFRVLSVSGSNISITMLSTSHCRGSLYIANQVTNFTSDPTDSFCLFVFNQMSGISVSAIMESNDTMKLSDRDQVYNGNVSLSIDTVPILVEFDIQPERSNRHISITGSGNESMTRIIQFGKPISLEPPKPNATFITVKVSSFTEGYIIGVFLSTVILLTTLIVFIVRHSKSPSATIFTTNPVPILPPSAYLLQSQ